MAWNLHHARVLPLVERAHAPPETSVSDIHVVLHVLALCLGAGFAQASDLVPPPLVAVEDVGAVEAEAPVPDEALPARGASAVEWQRDPPERVMGRVLVESMGGTLGGVGGGLVGLLAMLPLGGAAMDCSGDSCNARGLLAGAMVGWSLGAAIGVHGSGGLLAGRGRFLPTLGLGVLAGGASAGLYMAEAVGDEAVPLLLLLPLVTSIITYEVSSAAGPSRSSTLAAARPPGAGWMPTVEVSSRGGSLGLTGRF